MISRTIWGYFFSGTPVVWSQFQCEGISTVIC